MPDAPLHTDPQSRGYEENHISIRAAIWFLAIFAACAIIFHFGLSYFQARLMTHQAQASAVPLSIRQVQLQPEPRLQPSPNHSSNDWQDWRSLHEQQDHQLNSYGPVPNQPGFVHIPIEQAMTLYLQQQSTTAPATQPGGAR